MFGWNKSIKRITKYSDELRASNGVYPKLMGHKTSASVFLINKFKNKYYMVCLTPDMGDYSFGTILEVNE